MPRWTCWLLAACLAPAVAESPADRWRQRDTPAVLERTAREFLDLLVLDDFEQKVAKLATRPELVAVAKLARANQPVAALRAFERYFLAKLRQPTAAGLTVADVSPFARGVGGSGHYPSQILRADPDPQTVLPAAEALLLRGELTLGGKPTAIGLPGSVHWQAPLAPDEPVRRLGPERREPYRELWSLHGFTPLLEAFALTRDERYLRAWVDYLDDWALNCAYPDNVHPACVPTSVNPVAGEAPVRLVRVLGWLAQVLPPDRDVLPPGCFARAVTKVLRLHLLHILYIRANTHNWTPGPGTLLVALLYDEFKAAPLLWREGRRRNIEDNAATQNLRDGTENQQCPWYNANYLGVEAALRLLEARRELPAWKELPWVAELRDNSAWQQEIREHLAARARYFIHYRTPQNEWPWGANGGSKREATGIPGGDVLAAAPEAYADPECARIVATMSREPGAPPPSYDSEWFPYAGYNLVRTGWRPDDSYGHLFCSPQPGAYGGYRSRSNNNHFGLGAWGQDLLVSDDIGHYSYPSSPITVDGRQQFFHAGVYKAPDALAHKVYLVSAWTEPAPWRWHASDRFNLMEGVYAGGFANGAYPMPLAETLRGVTHQRLVFFARAHGLWIVADRLRTADRHEYEQTWLLPIKPSSHHAFEPDEIQLDAAGRTIRTVSSAATPIFGKPVPQVNVALHQFSAAPLTYAARNEPKRADDRGRPFGWQRVSARWAGAGDQQVVTAIYPRRGADELRGVRSLVAPGVAGFETTTPDGAQVRFLAATGGEADLTLGPVAVRAEALLLTGDGGLVLGCRGLRQGNAVAEPPASDFEFTLRGSQLTLRAPIYRPIAPVSILPARNVFVGSQEITLACATPGVSLHYTLDGSDPTPQSALYSAPFAIGHSAVVKARAYRPGVSANPPQLSGTHATVASRAVFTKAELLPCADASRARELLPGLLGAYYEGEWQRFWLGLDTVTPLRSAPVPALFDLSLASADNPPVGAAPAPRARPFALLYTGWLDVPADGVYTFHAPREWVMPDTEAGYDLQLWLGDRRVPWGWRTELAGLQQWYPATRLHALGNWSIALAKGPHPLRVMWLDYRTDAARTLNVPGLNPYVWDGVTPDLRVSGPGLDRQPLPSAWLRHTLPNRRGAGTPGDSAAVQQGDRLGNATTPS